MIPDCIFSIDKRNLFVSIIIYRQKGGVNNKWQKKEGQQEKKQ